LHWPAYSPDLSPIENIWGIAKRRIDKRRPKTVADVERFAKEAWASIRKDRPLLQRLFGSMTARLESVVANNGEITQY